MVHAPLRGLFFLGRTATVLVAAAAGAYVLKKNRRLAEQVGDTLIRAGENLRGEPKSAAAEPQTAEPVVQSEKAKTATKTQTSSPNASESKPKAAPRTAAKTAAKPKTKRPVTAKKRPSAKPPTS